MRRELSNTRFNMKIRRIIKNRKKLSGFSLVEVLLSVTLFTLFVLGLSGGLAYSMQSSEVTQYKSKAVFLADEGLEAARSLRNESYDALTAGTYGLDSSGSTWELTGSSDAVGEYTRTLEISDVDTNTKLITSKVTWPISVGGSNSVTVSAYLTNWLREISQIWVNPTIGNSLNFGGNQDATGIVYMNNYAYAVRATGSPNLIVIGISGSAPVIVNSSNIAVTPTGISVHPAGTFAAVTSGTNNGELNIFNLANPSVPSLASTYNASGNSDASSSYITQSNIVYVTRPRSNDKELIVLDVSNIAQPTLLGSIDFNSDLNDIHIDGNYAYVTTADTSQELVVFDITNPSTPTQVTSFNIEGNNSGTSIVKNGNSVYLGTTSGNVYIIDVGNVSSPNLIGSYATGGNSRINDIALNSDASLIFVGVGNNSETFNVVSLATPSAPTKLSFLDLSSQILGVAYDTVRDRVYAVGSDNNAEFVVINSQ
jgi:Tfp pilus assembly protein PilV